MAVVAMRARCLAVAAREPRGPRRGPRQVLRCEGGKALLNGKWLGNGFSRAKYEVLTFNKAVFDYTSAKGFKMRRCLVNYLTLINE